MFSQKHNQQTVGDMGTSPYTNVPAGAGLNGGTANYPASQKASGQRVGYGYDNVPASQKAGGTYAPAPGSYKADSNVVHPAYVQQGNGYDGGYVHQTPVSYGPDGTPIVVAKKRSRMRNAILGTLAVCCCCIAL